MRFLSTPGTGAKVTCLYFLSEKREKNDSTSSITAIAHGRKNYALDMMDCFLSSALSVGQT